MCNKFKYCKKRELSYTYNKNSYSNLRCLLFGNLSSEFLKDWLSLYFKELFIYWVHGSMNKKLIESFNPDIILEIRVERFLEHFIYTNWIINEEEIVIDKDKSCF